MTSTQQQYQYQQPSAPFSPSIAPPPNRRAISLMGTTEGFDLMGAEDQLLDMRPRSMDEQLALADSAEPQAAYAFDQGNNATFDDSEAAAALLIATGMDGDVVQQSVISPQQAQAMLAAQVLMQQHQSQQPQQGGWSNDPNSKDQPQQPDDDQLMILSMSRGNSNLQAALDELDSRTSGAHYAGSALSPTALNPPAEDGQMHPSGAQSSWQDYDGTHEQGSPSRSGYHSDAYTSATDDDHDTEMGGNINSNRRAPPLVNQRQEIKYSNQAGGQQASPYGGGNQSLQQNSPYGGQSLQQTSPPASSLQASHHMTQASLQTHNSQYSLQQSSYTLHSHHHSHSHHSHHHSHSIVPTVPPVVEQAEPEGADADGAEGEEENGMADENGTDGTGTRGQREGEEEGSQSLLLDSSFLHAIASQPPPHNPSYSRSSSASSVSSAGATGVNRSGQSSPQPNQRMTLSASPTMAQQLAAQHASVLSPTALPGRRHSGHNPLTVSHLLSPPSSTSANSANLPPREHRMIGRSPSADSLNLPSTGSQLHRTVSPHSPQPNSGRVGADGRALHLHPSPIQEQMQSQMQHQHHSPQPNSHHNYPSSQQQKHDSSSSASASSYQVKLELASSGASYQNANGRFSPSPANGRFSPSPAPPQNNPGFGRAFSHESALQQQPGQGQSQGQQSLQFSPQLYLKQELLSYKQEQAYFSDGGVDPSYVQVTSGPRSTAAFNAQYNVPSSAGGSPRGSHSLPHGFGRTLGTRRDSHEEHKHTAAAASNASSGSATPLHGPGPIRGCNSMGDLPRLLMLHAQNSQPSTLLPLCPSGSTTASIGSSSHSSHHHPHSSGSSGSSSSAASAMHAERIGAYSREERAKRLARYHDKRSRRCWSKRVLYACRKVFADGRKRVGGRFIKKQHPGCPCPDLCLPGCVNYVEPAESGATAPSSSGTTKATSSPPRSSRKK